MTAPGKCARSPRGSPASITAPIRTIPGVRDLTVSRSTKQAGENAGVGKGGVEVAELSAVCTPEELVLAEALGLGDDVAINPSGGALVANPVMVTGLARIGEAAKHVFGGGIAGVGSRIVGTVPAAEPGMRAGRTGVEWPSAVRWSASA